MLCAISGTVPKEPVVSKKSGHLFEKSLVTKVIKDIGLCPVTNEPLGLDDLIDIKSSMNVPVKADGATSVPGLLSLLQNEWDATALEMYGLRKKLQETRQELSHSLYQLDAATRVVARVLRERDEFRSLAEAGGRSEKPSRPGSDGPSCADDQPPKSKKTKVSALGESVEEELVKTSKEMISGRKKREISQTVATIEDFGKFELKDSYAIHDKRKGGGGVLALAGYPAGGDVVLTGGADGVAHIVDSSTGVCMTTLKDGGHSKKISSVASLGNSGRCLTASSVDGTVRLWDVNSSSCQLVIEDAGVLSVDVHPCAGYTKYFYSASPDSWSMFDVQRGESLVRVPFAEGKSTPYTFGALHPDGLVYSTGQSDGIIKLWEVRKQSVAGTLQLKEGSGGGISSIAFSENGYHMASADPVGVKVWDLRKLSCIQELELPEATSVVFDWSGLWLGASSTKKVEVFGVKHKYASVASFDNLPKKGAHSILFGKDARCVLVGSNELCKYA
jgi:pre-mRNA-processing factor 19